MNKNSGTVQQSRTAKKGDQTRERLFKAFLASMNENGYQNTHIRDVCAAAGVSVRTFYLYFSSKSDVIYGLFSETSKKFYAFITTSLTGETAYERLEEMVRLYARLNIDTPQERLRLILSPDQEWHNPDSGIWLALSKSLNDTIVKELTEGQASGEISTEYPAAFIARQISTALRGHTYIWCCENRSFDLEEESQESFRFIWKNICACSGVL